MEYGQICRGKHFGKYYCNNNWRASEASETLSGVCTIFDGGEEASRGLAQ